MVADTEPLDQQTPTLVGRDAAVYLHQAGSTPCLAALQGVEGVWLEDTEGRRILDFHGNSVHHLGYGHPHLIDVLKRQLEELPFTPRRFTNEPAVLLAEALSQLWPGGPGKILLATGGSDAIEIALKYARVATGRFKTISFLDSYHGSGFGAISIGGREKDRSPRLGPLLPGAILVPPFYRRGNCSSDLPVDAEIWAEKSIRAIEDVFQRDGEIAAVIAEPIRSTPHIPAKWYWPRVRQLCDEFGSLLIFDEIAIGLGKTGRLFASQHFDVLPDITVLGKSLGGGVVPIAAMIARPELDVAFDLPLGHYTHEKNPFTTRAALTTLEIIERDSLVQRAATVGSRAIAKLEHLRGRHSVIRSVRGRGLLLGIEFFDDRAESVMRAAFEKGLNCSATENRHLTLSPPLVITDSQVDQAVDILDQVLRSA